MFVSNTTSRADKALKYFDSSAIKTTCAKIYLDESVDGGKVYLLLGVRGRKVKHFALKLNQRQEKINLCLLFPSQIHACRDNQKQSREYGIVACCSMLGLLSQKHRIIPPT